MLFYHYINFFIRLSVEVVLFEWYFSARNIEDLTSQINNLEINVNDLEMENEELRERLGLDPKVNLNIEDIRQKKKVKTEQAAALNRVLSKEVRDRPIWA